LQSFSVAIDALRIAFRRQYQVKVHAISVLEAEYTLLNVFVLGFLCPFNMISEFHFFDRAAQLGQPMLLFDPC
jgi:hypothetical protein